MSAFPGLRAVYPAAFVQATVVGVAAPLLLLWAVIGRFPGEEPVAFEGVVAAMGLVAGAHWGCDRFLRWRGAPRPWGPPAVVTAAVLAGAAVILFAWARWDSLPLLVPVLLFLLCPPVALAGVAVLRSGRRLPSALGAVLVVNALVAGALWWTSEAELDRRREAVSREVAAFPVPIAVLDSPGWEAAQVSVGHDLEKASIYYAPVRRAPEPAGFRLVMTTRTPMGPRLPGDRSPLFEGCGVGVGHRSCEEYGDAVFLREEDGSGEPEREELRVPLPDGNVAVLHALLPRAKDGSALIPFPDVGMVDLVDHIRQARPGEVEELAASL
ncbi:hypothetical protein [Nocardiopsis protaetiae]|uniref:hypothetical protein n=2 Tax=Nocardiopsis protaetiae TaxID=3382270 RepID=UPI00387AE7A5